MRRPGDNGIRMAADISDRESLGEHLILVVDPCESQDTAVDACALCQGVLHLNMRSDRDEVGRRDCVGRIDA
jgi:hypothetical protein